MSDLTPEKLDDMRRSLDDMRALATREGVYNGNRAVLNIIALVEPLLDEASALRAEVDQLVADIDRVRELTQAQLTPFVEVDDVLRALDGVD